MGKGKCPICGKSTIARHRPFCSERCAYVDLSKWLQGGYRLPTDEAPAVYEGDPDAREDGER